MIINDKSKSNQRYGCKAQNSQQYIDAHMKRYNQAKIEAIKQSNELTQKDIYIKRLELEHAISDMKILIETTNNCLLELHNNCSHDLILVFDDHNTHKVGRVLKCFCVACGKEENIYFGHEFKDSIFINSKKIDLTSIPMHNFDNHIALITRYIFDNYDKCDSHNFRNEISKKILKSMEENNFKSILTDCINKETEENVEINFSNSSSIYVDDNGVLQHTEQLKKW